MNDILQLKGSFEQVANEAKPSGRNIPKNSSAVTSDDIRKLLEYLKSTSKFWSDETVIKNCLIDARYIGVVAKSNRIGGFLYASPRPNDFVRGARFEGTGSEKRKHVITYYVSRESLDKSIDRVEKCIKLLDYAFGGSLNHEEIGKLPKGKQPYSQYGISKSSFRNVVVDTHYLEMFSVPDNSVRAQNQSIITIYKTDDITPAELMRKVGIEVDEKFIYNDTTLLLFPNEISTLIDNARYLIAMETTDLSEFNYEKAVGEPKKVPIPNIPAPENEPVIGVIDTMFDESAYFSRWVTFEKRIPGDPEPRDYTHGTSVTSIIVDGPTINPDLDDGCGRFQVRHFGVMRDGVNSSFYVMTTIRKIVNQNPDIKVWNLSLGSPVEINENSISPEAAVLDEIQCEKDVIFVVAGTNKQSDDPMVAERIGSPADSINAVVVNSVNRAGEPATYARRGPVLSFFNKPDVSSYGGDEGELIKVRIPDEAYFKGTSYAAPWVTRKLAYLIQVLGLPRETAKALLVDAASGWDNTGNDQALAPLIGHGVVPKRIEDVLRTGEDEIKFVINDISKEWSTYAYNLPVPTDEGKHPFAAKATLCYFPRCSIDQGVDYTNTELDFHVGRFDGKKLRSVNRNIQNMKDGAKHYLDEKDARLMYRKWDNTKHVSDIHPERIRAKEAYGSGMWGVRLVTTERLSKKYGKGLKFGIVVTLKEINGENRVNEFVRLCRFQGWVVNRINVENRVDIYNKAQESITLDV